MVSGSGHDRLMAAIVSALFLFFVFHQGRFPFPGKWVRKLTEVARRSKHFRGAPDSAMVLRHAASGGDWAARGDFGGRMELNLCGIVGKSPALNDVYRSWARSPPRTARCAGHRRVRHGQGLLVRALALQQPAPGQSPSCRQLRGHPPRTPRIRTLRPRKRGLHLGHRSRPGRFELPTAEPSSSTRSGRWT